MCSVFYFENWPYALCRSFVWLPAWLDNHDAIFPVRGGGGDTSGTPITVSNSCWSWLRPQHSRHKHHLFIRPPNGSHTHLHTYLLENSYLLPVRDIFNLRMRHQIRLNTFPISGVRSTQWEAPVTSQDGADDSWLNQTGSAVHLAELLFFIKHNLQPIRERLKHSELTDQRNLSNLRRKLQMLVNI